jgi:protein-ribulosamine 3-kinase
MIKSEFRSMNKLHAVLPKFAPTSIASGTYITISDTHCLLCEFREMTNHMPDPDKLAPLLSRLHQNSVSPNGNKFGLPIITYACNLPQFVGWEDSWEVFFTQSMRKALD